MDPFRQHRPGRPAGARQQRTGPSLPPVEPGILIVANRRGFTLRSTELRATNGTLIICDARERAEARAIVVSYNGRPRVAWRDSAREIL